MSSPENAENFLDAREPLPFEDMFVPLVLKARRALRREVGETLYNLLTPLAHTGWEKYLLVRLTRVGAKAAHWQFQIFKTVRQVFPRDHAATPTAANSLYREFTGERTEDRLQGLYDEFPGLARLCGILVKNWIATVAEFLARLEADHQGLSDFFKAARYVLPIIHLEAGLSDPHRGGKCVAKVQFEDGARIVYKPRSLAPEAHFSVLLRNLNSTGIPHLLYAVNCWDRGEYGWMENIDQGSCTAQTEVHAFYWRAGALLGLVHLAYGVDFHRENIIADGQNPVIVDLEALWHPYKFAEDAPTPASDSVLWTGFLPHGDVQQGAIFKWSALGSQLHPEQPAQTWVRVNQDDMALEDGRPKFRAQTHLPSLAGAACLASDYVPDIQAGFRWVGEKLLGNDETKEKFKQWLYVLTKCPRRLILRSTLHYQTALERRTTPQSLRREQTLTVQRLSSPQNSETSRREHQALDQFDVPYFMQTDHLNIELRSLTDWNPSMEGYLAQLPIIGQSLGYPSAPAG